MWGQGGVEQRWGWKGLEKADTLKQFAQRHLQSQGIQLLSFRQVVFNSRWWFFPPGTFGDVWRHISLSHLGGAIIGIWWVRVRDAPKHLTMHRDPQHKIRNCLTEDVSNAEVENPHIYSLSLTNLCPQFLPGPRVWPPSAVNIVPQHKSMRLDKRQKYSKGGSQVSFTNDVTT